MACSVHDQALVGYCRSMVIMTKPTIEDILAHGRVVTSHCKCHCKNGTQPDRDTGGDLWIDTGAW